jgi:diguanylate cyclase (GGDEF)-like protein/PAS domain S-box-containing protein
MQRLQQTSEKSGNTVSFLTSGGLLKAANLSKRYINVFSRALIPLQTAPFPPAESDRLATLQALDVLDTAHEPEFDALVQAAAAVCGAPISLISLIDAQRQWFKANTGLPGVSETPREVAFCAHAILQDGVFEVENAAQDARFADNPFVTGEPGIRFYAGAPVVLRSGHAVGTLCVAVGTLCVIDREPRQLTANQRAVLMHLAQAAAHALEARRALQNESRTAALLKHSVDAIASLDLEGRVRFWNPAAEQLFGFSAAEMLGQTVDLLEPQARHGEHAAALAELARTGAGRNYETTRKHRDGSEIAVSITLIPVLDNAGRVAGATKVIRDIRPRVASQTALRESEARFRALSETSPLGIFATDAHGQCTYTNSRWQEIYGLTLEQSLGEGWSATLHPLDRAAVFAHWQQTSEAKTEFDMEFRVRQPSGLVRDVRARARPSLDAAGQVTGFVGTVEDITQRRQMEQALRRSEQLLNRTGALAQVGGWELDLALGQPVWSDQTCRIHGVAPGYRPKLEEAINFYAPEARPVIQAAVEHAFATGQGWDLELPFIQANGNRIWVRAVGQADFEDGKPVRLLGAFQDITQQIQQRRELEQQHELLAVTLRSIGDAVITTDAAGNVEWLNPAAERLTGWTSAQAKGHPLQQVFHVLNEQTRQLARNPVAVCLESAQATDVDRETVLISRTGSQYGIEDSAAPIRNGKGEVLGAVLVFRDVTEQRRLSGEMSYRATHDALTGLSNRSEFENRLRRLLLSAQEDHSEHALLYIDLDQFKLVNDACGHAVGDELLQQVAKLLRETIRARDTLARLGGDEFAAILEHCTVQQAQTVAQKICDRMDDYRFAHDGRRFRIGASIGVVPVDRRWSASAAILQAADTSCYAAKEAGRNRVHAWFDTDHAMRARHGEMQWAARIEQALDEDSFELHFQRIHPLLSAEPGLHAEVLLRMRGDTGELVMPGAFLPAAERFHLASRVDRWVLRNVIDWLRTHAQANNVRQLSVNLSGQSVGDRAFHRYAAEMLSTLEPSLLGRLCVEVTETVAVTNMTDAALFIKQIRALGVRVALDDFGAGAASFGYLKNLPVDYLKIDGQFIKDLLDDPLDLAAVKCFVDVARVMGIKTVAEFVDRQPILEELKRLGVDYAQGFLLHKPQALLAPAAVAAMH